ncbi:uncharacterized protein M421DRAFT_420352 [Didymella exigua CBS 183.55]|uniref:Uncharacterized protein n=1 Tax=Didymella exigua CBS 183.55 TaxID=1150837 RepID=A0A6A5RL19_9PLEO|nr:uncharacterized protein M421DRAFT_420352 [Didymella exigua CBS 183.55]KAF1929131.1 hypothetical protein M421DRAFT_420352 [Didymella exigua CBS 183.55]
MSTHREQQVHSLASTVHNPRTISALYSARISHSAAHESVHSHLPSPFHSHSTAQHSTSLPLHICTPDVTPSSAQRENTRPARQSWNAQMHTRPQRRCPPSQQHNPLHTTHPKS